MSTWLDTETKALLQQVPPDKFAPADTGMYTLVLVRAGPDKVRMAACAERIPGVASRPTPPGGKQLALLAGWPHPGPMVRGLSLSDALLGQFELICSDAISVFLRDEVVSSTPPEELLPLCARFLRSSEFEEVAVDVAAVPHNQAGNTFVNQFLGESEYVWFRVRQDYTYEGRMMRKKARIMAHWAEKIGAKATIAEDH